LQKALPPHVEFLAKRRLKGNADPQPKALLRWLVEGLSGILATGFIGSMLVNSIVFASWRLSFPQLASASDVVNSGLQLSWPVACCVVAAALGSGAQIMIFRLEPRRRRVADTGAGILIAILALASCWWAIALIVADPQKNARLDIWLISYVFVAFAGGYGRTKNILKPSSRSLDRDHVRQGLNDMLLIVGGAGFSLVLFNMTATMSSGFLGGGYRLVEPLLPGTCEGAVLWTGERAIVVRCAAGERPTVVIGAENAILTPIAKARR